MPRALPRNPLRNYQFRVGFMDPARAGAPATGSGYVAGVKRISGLNLSIEVNEVWSGGNSLHRYANPDKVTWDPVTLEQGLALSSELEDWARAALDFIRTAQCPDLPLKRNVFIDVWDPYVHVADSGGSREDSTDTCLRRYVLFNAWISRYQAVPQLDAMANEVALLTVELVHEGWRIATPEDVSTGFRRLGGDTTETMTV